MLQRDVIKKEKTKRDKGENIYFKTKQKYIYVSAFDFTTSLFCQAYFIVMLNHIAQSHVNHILKFKKTAELFISYIKK